MTSKGLRELLDRQSRERQRMVEVAALDELNQEIRCKLDALEGSLSDLERRIRATRASFDAGDQAPRMPEQTRRRWSWRKPNAAIPFLRISWLLQSSRSRLSEREEMTLQAQISISLSIRFRRSWLKDRATGKSGEAPR